MNDSRTAGEGVRPDAARPAEGAAAGSAAGSATGVFGAVVAPPAKSVPAPVAAVSPPAAPVAPPPPAAAEPVHPVVHRVVVGGSAAGRASDYDELLNRLRAGGASAVAPPAAPAERKSAETGSAPAANAKVGTATGATASAPAPASGGLSQILRTLDVQPAAGGERAAVAPAPPAEARPAELRPIAAREIDLRAPIQGADLADLLRVPAPAKTLELAPEAKSEAKAEAKAGSRVGSDAPHANPPGLTPPASAPVAPGTFTQMLRAVEAKDEAVPSAASFAPAAAAPAVADPTAGQSSPGTFTQMLRAVEAEGGDGPARAGIAPAATAPAAAVQGSPGTFTQMLRAVESSNAQGGSGFASPATTSTAPGPGAPGTFTQLFQTLDSGVGSAPAQPVPAARFERPPAQRRDEGSFTQMLSTQRPQDPASYPEFREPQKVGPAQNTWDSAPAQGFGAPASFGQPREPERRPEPPQSSGGLTQLLRALDGPGSAPRRDEAPLGPSPAAGPGMFTQTYQRLEGHEQPEFAPHPPVAAPVQPSGAARPFSSGATGFNQPAPAMAAPAGGQSEFTRILDASRMREMGLRGGGGGTEIPQTGPAAQPPMPQPPQMPPRAMPPPQPAMPQAPGYPMPAYPAYAPPPAPAMAAPAMPPAAPAVQPAPPAKTPQVLPLILIGVIFLLVVVVIALVFLMKR